LSEAKHSSCMSEVHLLSPEGTPSPEKVMPCQPAPRPIFPTAPSEEYDQSASYPGWGVQHPLHPDLDEHHGSKSQRSSTWKVLSTTDEYEGRQATGNVNHSEAKSVDNLKRELQSSEAEISALRLALEAATEEIR
jgi:hypothetical protein